MIPHHLTLYVVGTAPAAGCHDDFDSGEERHAELEFLVVFVKIRRASRDLWNTVN